MDALRNNDQMKKFQIGLYEKAVPEEYSIKETLQFCKESGYDFLEISIDRSEKRINRLYDSDFRKMLRRYIGELDFPIGSMCLSALGTYTLGSPNLQTEEKAISIIFQAVSFAEELGLRIVQIPACDVPKNEKHTFDTDTKFITNLKMIVEYAAAHSVIIGLENMEDTYMDNVEKCMRVIDAIKSPYFLLYSDSGNITSAAKIYGTDVKKDMLTGKDKYCALHLKETRPNKYGGLFYGEGHVDFNNIIKTAWQDLGIRRYVLEYWYTGNTNWKRDLEVARCKCEAWIQNAEMKGNY